MSLENYSTQQLEKIWDGAPDSTATHCVMNTGVNYYSVDFGSVWDYDLDDWNDSDYRTEQELRDAYQSVLKLSDIRAELSTRLSNSAKNDTQSDLSVEQEQSVIERVKSVLDQIEGYKILINPSAEDEIHNHALDIAMREIKAQFKEVAGDE